MPNAMQGIASHIAVAKADRDLAWIKRTLQYAIALEHATLPYYLSATYSLEVQNYTAYNLLRSVAMEEMVHMAIACNILAALGGRPAIKTLAPAYPSKGLPGGAEPDLTVWLAPLSKPLLLDFMRLEAPLSLLDPAFQQEDYPTIARLYDAILDAVRANREQIGEAMKVRGGANQIGDDIGFPTFTYVEGKDPLPDIEAAIEEILAQGEGCTSDSLHAGASSQQEETHYCKFAEIYYGHQFETPQDIPLTKANERLFFTGYPIPFPEVRNTLAVPQDGYAKLLAKDPQGAAVAKDLLAFDQAYSGLMADLDAMWNGPIDVAWPTFGRAVETMAKLRVLACFDIQKYQVPPEAVAMLSDLYHDEFDSIAKYTDLKAPVYYGPRFRNLNAA